MYFRIDCHLLSDELDYADHELRLRFRQLGRQLLALQTKKSSSNPAEIGTRKQQNDSNAAANNFNLQRKEKTHVTPIKLTTTTTTTTQNNSQFALMYGKRNTSWLGTPVVLGGK
jgi:hypothetical protein